MEIRIYPRKVYNRFRALVIDGRTYLGVESAIDNYLKDNGIKIANVKWKINDTTIVANTVNDFADQFYKLNIEFKEV